MQIRISSQQFDGYAAHPGQLAINDDIQQNAMDTEQADGVAGTTMEATKTNGRVNGTDGESTLENGSIGNEANEDGKEEPMLEDSSTRNEDNEANKDDGKNEEPMFENSSTQNEDNEADQNDGNIAPQDSNSDVTTTMEE